MSAPLVCPPVAVIRTCFDEKFGVPRQPGLVPAARGRIVFEPAYRNADTLRGLEGFSHLWVIFHFDRAEGWSPTVRPPRLGGNTRVGVFASRSPFRPNPIGLSVVRIEGVDTDTPEGPVVRVSGVDLVDGTPILDLKPYVPYSDALPEARGGFAPEAPGARLPVDFAPGVRAALGDEAFAALVEETLSLDPRPAFHEDGREYGVSLRGRNIRFRVADGRCLVVSAG